MRLRYLISRTLLLLLFPLLTHTVTAQVVAGISANNTIVNRGDTVAVCLGSALTFRSVGQGSLNISWRFNGGSIPVASGIGPFTIIYSAEGYDTVFQKITADNYADSTFLIVKVSNNKPTAAYSWTPDGDCGNNPVQFTNQSTVTPLTYAWNFGDGGTSTEASPSYPFLNAVGVSGTSSYNVNLTVSNKDGCSATVSHLVTVKNTPDASLGNADAGVQFGMFNGNATFKRCNNIPSYVFKFTNQSSTTAINTGYTIQWGDGQPDSSFTSWPAGVVVAHTFPLGGSTMTVKVLGANGCTGIKKYTVFLGSTPAGGLASLGNTDICASDSLRFAINNISGNPPGTLYSFLINDGSQPLVFTHPPPDIVGHFFAQGSCSFVSSSGNSTFNNAFGAYLTIQNPCGTTSPSVVPIYVSGKPRAGIYVYPSKTVCTQSSVFIESTSTYGSVITATGGTGSTCTNTGTQVWEISPSTGFTIQSGSMGSLNNSHDNGLLWTNGSALLNVNFNTPGTYTVKLYVFNNRCGMDSTVETICVRNPPQASFTLPAKSRCGAGTLALTNTSPLADCGGDSYSWKVTYLDPLGCGGGVTTPFSFTGGTGASSYSPTLQLNAPGKYVLQLTVTALNAGIACSPAVSQDTFTVVGTPKGTLQGLATICPGSSISPMVSIDSCYSAGPFSYQWQFAGGAPAGAAAPVPGSVSYAAVGSYPVTLTVTDNACNTTSVITDNLSVIPPPVANAGNDTTVCSSASFRMGVPGVAGVTYRWSPAAGLSDATAANPLARLNYTGTAADTTFIFTLEATVGSNCSATDEVRITVRRRPTVTVLPDAPALCAGGQLTLMASGADLYTWSPAVATGSATGDQVIVQPAASTLYTLIGSLTGGCSDTVTVPVTVHPNAKALFTAAQTTICNGTGLDKLITVTPYPLADGQYTWWDNGVLFGTNTTGAFPGLSIPGSGSTDTIKLVAVSPFGCLSDSMAIIFHTLPSVIAHFSKPVTAGCGPLKVDFTNDTPPATAAQYFWNFGNGQTSLLPQPGTVTFLPSPYHRDTTYTIVLKAYNGCDTTVWKDSVTVYPDPLAAFTVSSVLGCSPFADTLINLSAGNITSFDWDFGDDTHLTTSSFSNIVHTYHVGVIDTFTVVLSATNRCGVHSDSLDIVVTPNTIRPTILVNGNALFGCAPFTARFINNSNGAAQIAVNFNDGTPVVIIPGNQPVITHQYLKAGVYPVNMRLTNACADTSISLSISVFTAPVPSFTVDPNPLCTGKPVFTTNRSTNGNSYLWNWGDSTTSNAENPSHVYAKGGDYPVRLTASLVNNFGTVCQVSSDPVVVRSVDLIPAVIDTGTNKPCVPYTLAVKATGAAGAASVDWTFYDPARGSGPFRASGMTASYQYNTPGVYQVMLVVTNIAGCSDTAYHTFRVSATPKLTFTPLGTLYTCNTDTTLNLSVGAGYTGNDGIAYSWTINGQRVGAGTPFQYRLQLPGGSFQPVDYIIRASVSNDAGCVDSATIGTLTVRPLPAPRIVTRPDSILYQPDYTFSFLDSIPRYAGIRYAWDFGDMNGGSTLPDPSHRYGDTGVYYVKLQVADEATKCRKSDTTHVRIVYIAGYLYVADAICPGCSVAELRNFLPKGKGLKEYHLRIYNAWGQLIFETTKLDADGKPSEPWNVRFNGQTVQQDAYRWQIEAKYVNGTEWKGMLYPGKDTPVKSGFITVVK